MNLLGIFLDRPVATVKDVALYYYKGNINLGTLQGCLEANCQQGWLQKSLTGEGYSITSAGRQAFEEFLDKAERDFLESRINNLTQPFILHTAENRPVTFNQYVEEIQAYWQKNIDPELVASCTAKQIEIYILETAKREASKDINWCLLRGWIRLDDKLQVLTITNKGIEMLRMLKGYSKP